MSEKKRNDIKRKIAYSALSAAIMGSSTLTALAAPVQMADGTVFDRDYYAAVYPDIPMALGKSDTVSLYMHYLEHGIYEGRQPCAPGAKAVGIFDFTTGDIIPFEDDADEEEPTDGDTEEGESEGIKSPASPIANTPKQYPELSKNDPRNALRNRLKEIRLKREAKFAPTSPEDFYKDTVFVGDSIMLGFRNYAAKRPDNALLSELNFLAAGSFGANNALKPVGKDSVHPVYKGEQKPIWESIGMMDCKRMFILMGLNDLNLAGLEGSLKKYEQVLDNILKEAPDIQVNIISMPYVLSGSEKGKLNNDSIREYNTMLQDMAKRRGFGYMDIATALQDENGNLKPKYCSDGFLHQTPAAYDEWLKVMIAYAGF